MKVQEAWPASFARDLDWEGKHVRKSPPNSQKGPSIGGAVVANPSQPIAPVTDARLLAAMLQDAERVIDHQVQAIEELDDKSEHMIGLGVALLAGGLSLATFVVGKDANLHPDWWFFGFLCAGGVANLVAIVAFLESYIGFKHGVEVVVGPSLDWVHSKTSDEKWNIPSHYLSLLSSEGYPSYYRFNLRKMKHSAKARRFGLFCLAGAVLLFTISLVLILGRAI